MNCLLKNCPHSGSDLMPLMIATLHTGLRQSKLSSLTCQNSDLRNCLISAEEGCAKKGEIRRALMNEMLTPALRTTKINELVWPVFRNRPHVPATHTTAR
jgi:hypothetical protein